MVRPEIFLSGIAGHKTVLFDTPPTAEHLAQTAFAILDRHYVEEYPGILRLERVWIYETPNCWADAVSGTA